MGPSVGPCGTPCSAHYTEPIVTHIFTTATIIAAVFQLLPVKIGLFDPTALTRRINNPPPESGATREIDSFPFPVPKDFLCTNAASASRDRMSAESCPRN